MKPSKRVLINTIAQYIRTFINMGLSLYTVRLVLITLGQSDFGIYSLIAGVVSMLSFLTNSLVTTTQRFISFYQGKGVIEEVKKIFNNSLILHIVIGLTVAVLLASSYRLLFDGFLNIPEKRMEASVTVFQTVVVILFFTFIASPFRALLISHENIIYISVIDVVDGLLKVILVTIMTCLNYDKLILYGIMILLIQIANFFAMSIYCYIKYEECCLPNLSIINKSYLIDLISYAGWNVYQTGCIVGRQQGIAVILNKTMGTVVNASYGIGFQIAGYTNFLSSSIINAISPQIIKAEGGGDRQRVLWLSNIACKFTFFLLSAVCIPTILEIDAILELWLMEVPQYANIFCIMVLCALLCDAVSLGLAQINQAIGKIGSYSLAVNTPKILSIPFVFFIIKNGYSIEIMAFIYIIIEFVCSIIRVFFIKKTSGLDICAFLYDVVLREMASLMIYIVVCLLFVKVNIIHVHFFVTFIFVVPIYVSVFYFVGMNNQEKRIISNMLFEKIK